MNCLDDTQLAMFVRGEFAVEEVSRFEAHLDQCDRCLALVAEAAERSTAGSDAGESHDPRDDSVFVHLLAAIARRSDRRPAADAAPAARDRFGRFRVVDVLGRGAMGVVYRAVDDVSGRSVAVKTVARPSPKILAALRQEVEFLQGRRHPGVVAVLASGVVDGDPWYAMELLEGQTLEQFNGALWHRRSNHRATEARSEGGREAHAPTPLAAGGRLDEVLALFARLCEPLAFVHREGIVHCDLKPANVFLCDDGRPVLMDFGLLSRAGGAVGRETLEVGGRLRGTLPYLAPELIRGQIPDARADLYALGCILYETITGRPPFVASTANGFLEGHLHRKPAPASRWVAGVPPRIDDLLASLLAKRSAQRIGAAELVADVLRGGEVAPQAPARGSTGRSTPYLFRPRIVGRDGAIDRILACGADAQRGAGRLVLVSGESGIGKTFLASEIAQRMARAGFDVVTGECVPLSAAEGRGTEVVGAALEPFRRLIQHAADRCRDDPAGATIRLFGSTRSAALLARYEPSLAHLVDASGGADALGGLPPTAERERVLEALSDLLERLGGEAPLLLVIDDLQWADDLSLAFLDYLSQGRVAPKRALVLALYRTEEVSKPIGDLEKREAATIVRLDRLDAAALKILVGDLLAESPPDRFVEALALHSEGVPFFVAEYLRAAAAEGVLRRTAGGWTLAPSEGATGYDGLALPASLQGLLERRLGALTSEAQALTEAAAVLGRDFATGMLVEVAGADDDSARRPLAEMLERQIVQRVSGDDWRFLHDKLREAAYARIPRARRTVLHAKAAGAIERTSAGRPDLPARFAELAYHWREGGDLRKAIDYLEKAGDLALRVSADADAVRSFDDARDLALAHRIPIPPARRASWARMTGDALYGLGDLEASARHLTEAVALLGAPMPETPARMAVSALANVGRQVVRRSLPRGPTKVVADGGASVLDAARSYGRLQQIHYYRGEYGRLLVANLASLNLSELAPPSAQLVSAYTNAGAAAGIVPLHGLASLYFSLAEDILKAAYDVEAESYLRMGHGTYLGGIGDWDRAVESCDRALQLAGRLGYHRRWEEVAAVRALVSRDFDERLDLALRGAESALRRSDPQTAAWCLMNAAEVHWARGDRTRGAECIAKVEATMPKLGTPERISVFAQRALHRLAAGDRAGAEGAADEAAQLVRQSKPIHFGFVDSYARIAEVQLALSAAAPAASRHAKARAACSDLATASRVLPAARPSYCLHEGARRWLGRRPARAIALWERGLHEARRLRLPFREVQLLAVLARHRPDRVIAAEAERAARRLGLRPADALLSPFGVDQITV